MGSNSEGQACCCSLPYRGWLHPEAAAAAICPVAHVPTPNLLSWQRHIWSILFHTAAHPAGLGSMQARCRCGAGRRRPAPCRSCWPPCRACTAPPRGVGLHWACRWGCCRCLETPQVSWACHGTILEGLKWGCMHTPGSRVSPKELSHLEGIMFMSAVAAHACHGSLGVSCRCGAAWHIRAAAPDAAAAAGQRLGRLRHCRHGPG
jgi:hypothetical protein